MDGPLLREIEIYNLQGEYLKIEYSSLRCLSKEKSRKLFNQKTQAAKFVKSSLESRSFIPGC